MRPNLLLITADDMNWDAVGANGGPVPDTTPCIDRFARDGIRFVHGHVTIAVCQPSRSSMMTGRYPHSSGGEGFHRLRIASIPVLPELLRQAGYAVGILGKVDHSTPHERFRWDAAVRRHQLGHGRNPACYRQHLAEFLDAAGERPFFMMANAHDPHRPFYGNDEAAWYQDAVSPAAVPSRTFSPAEVVVPGFLEDLPEVRREIAEYYSSVRRCDDTIGEILAELDVRGLSDNTLVVFLSDNGMAFPFAKTNCYLNSTRTPLVVRWPAFCAGGVVDDAHLVSAVDLMPTFLAAAGVAIPEGVQGRSFLSLLQGTPQPDREWVYTLFNQTYARRNYPMRSVQSRDWLYIWNPWSDGQRVFHNESQSGRTFDAMVAASEQDASIAARVQLFLRRVPEELYDLRTDPNARNNLVESPSVAGPLADCRQRLLRFMAQTDDPAHQAFLHRGSEPHRQEFLAACVQTLGGT